MTTTVTWTTTPIPAHRLAAGDRVYLRGLTRPVDGIRDAGNGRIEFMHGIYGCIAEHGDVAMVEVPDEPVDGYDLVKPRPGWSPLGCTCLSRRGDDRNWHIVATDDGCASHGVNDLYDD